MIFLTILALISSQPGLELLSSLMISKTSVKFTGFIKIESVMLDFTYDKGSTFDLGILLARDVPTFTKKNY